LKLQEVRDEVSTIKMRKKTISEWQAHIREILPSIQKINSSSAVIKINQKSKKFFCHQIQFINNSFFARKQFQLLKSILPIFVRKAKTPQRTATGKNEIIKFKC
jgi:hypothetical protein